MKKTMLLEEAIRKGIIAVGDVSKGILGDYIEYKTERKNCVLTPEQTGWPEEQLFKTEHLNWRLEKVGDEVILIADDATMSKIYLKGKIGYEKGIDSMNYLCGKLYTNFLAENVIIVNGDMFERGVSYCASSYWVDSSSSDIYFGTEYFCIRIASSGRMIDSFLYGLNGNAYSGYYGIRPIVFLKPDVWVEIPEEIEDYGSNKKAWHIFYPSKSELEQLIKECEERISKAKKALDDMK